MIHFSSTFLGFGLSLATNQAASGSTPMNRASRARGSVRSFGTSLIRALTTSPNAGHCTRRPCAAILEHHAACWTAAGHRRRRS